MAKPYYAFKSAFLTFALVLTATRKVRAEECKESRLTAKPVPSCPRTDEERREAVLQKNCSHIYHSCSSFEYHCVINAWVNETIEVCAPTRLIVGHACTEFSYGGNRIQRNSQTECKKCPPVYNSIDSYKYQECYKYESIKRSMEYKNSHEVLFQFTSKSTFIPTKKPFPIVKNDTLMSRLYINRPSGCCEGFMFSDVLNKCVECGVGYYGENCTTTCPYDSYGKECQMICNCSKDECDFQWGCGKKEFGNGTSLEELNTTGCVEGKSKISSNTSLKYALIGLITLFGLIIVLHVVLCLNQKR